MYPDDIEQRQLFRTKSLLYNDSYLELLHYICIKYWYSNNLVKLKHNYISRFETGIFCKVVSVSNSRGVVLSNKPAAPGNDN